MESFRYQPGRSEFDWRQCQVDELQVPPATRATEEFPGLGRSEFNWHQCQVDGLQVPPATRGTDESTGNFPPSVFGVKVVLLAVKSTFARVEAGREQWYRQVLL